MALRHVWHKQTGTMLVGAMLALLLLPVPYALTGCASQQDGSTPASTDTTSDDGSTDDQGEETIEFAGECTDRRGDATCFAVAELDGKQLETLLLEQDYVWSERNRMWVKEDGSSSVTVLDSEGESLTNIQVEELASGGQTDDVSYRLVTSGYSSVKRAFAALAGNIMTCEDSEFADESGVAVVRNSLDERLLVFVSTSNDTHVLTIVSNDAIAAGTLNKLGGMEVGTTVDEAFETLTGRKPAAEEPL